MDSEGVNIPGGTLIAQQHNITSKAQYILAYKSGVNVECTLCNC